MKLLRVIILTFAIILSYLTTAAEPAPTYTLKTSDLSAFLTATQSILNRSDLSQAETRSIVDISEAEFAYRYLNAANYKERRQAFDVLKVEMDYQSIQYPSIDLNQWAAWMVEAWLKENPTDLDAVETLQFDDFQAMIQQRDFNNDGTHEWLLDLTKGADGAYFEYRNWMVITRQDNGFHAVAVPIWPGYKGEWSFPTAYSRQPSEGDFIDITDDGIPEWFIDRDISTTGNIPGQTTQQSILSWQDGQLVNLMPRGDYASIENLDSDAAMELFRQQVQQDSWGCLTIKKSIYDWNGSSFEEGQPITEKQNCFAREAEEAMWRGDFQSAIQNYNAFLDANQSSYTQYTDCLLSPDGIECNMAFGVDLIAIYNYFLTRRLIAYASSGDKQNFDADLAALRSDPVPDSLAQTILSLNSTDPATICKAAYDFFDGANMGYASFSTEYAIFTPGEAYEDISSYIRSSAPYDFGDHRTPTRAGCDISLFSSEPRAIPTVTPSPIPTYTPYPTLIPERSLLYEPIGLYFRLGDYDSALWITEHIHERGSIEANTLFETQYWQALTLEALGREEEALIVYTTLANNAPNSIWAVIAGLHFQCAAGC